MDLSQNDFDFSSILIKRYTYYKLTDLEVLIILVSDKLFSRGEKILLTRDILSKHMTSSKDDIDAALTDLINKDVIEIIQDGDDIYSSLDKFKKRIYLDLIKDIRLGSEGNDNKSTSSLYAYIEQINSRNLSAVDRDYISKWLKSGVSENLIKEACNRNKNSRGYISFSLAEKYILDAQRSLSRKEIGTSTIDEEHEKDNADILFGDWTDEN